MSPKTVTVGRNSATIIELPGEDTETKRFIQWEDVNADNIPVTVNLEIRRHGNNLYIRFEEWDGEHPEAILIASGALVIEKKLNKENED